MKIMDLKLLDGINYGPFKAKYHRENTNRKFKEALIKFLENNVVSQLTIDCDRIEGNLLAAYDEDRYCGSHSLVKNIYNLEIKFIKGETTEFLTQDIVYYPELVSFSVRGKRRLYLWTLDRQKQAKYQEIKDICQSILQKNILVEKCPKCSAKLRIADEDFLFYVGCRDYCFEYNYRRNPKTKQLLHGYFFLKEPD